MNKKILVFVCDGKKFLILRNNPKDPAHGGDYWFTVTGSMEKNESKKEAIKREIKEETNLDVKEISVEHFYFGAEGENLAMPEINPQERVKALSLSMGYHYSPRGRVKAKFRNQQNKNSRVLYCTYGLGTQRTFYALFDSHRDERGFNLPLELVPFQFSLIPVRPDDNEAIEGVYKSIRDRAILDDRRNLLFGEKVAFSDYVGVPWKIIYGNGHYTLKSRDELISRVFNSTEELTRYLETNSG